MKKNTMRNPLGGLYKFLPRTKVGKLLTEKGYDKEIVLQALKEMSLDSDFNTLYFEENMESINSQVLSIFENYCDEFIVCHSKRKKPITEELIDNICDKLGIKCEPGEGNFFIEEDGTRKEITDELLKEMFGKKEN